MSTRTVHAALASYRAQLGKVPDQTIADMAGVSRSSVVLVRREFNIPAYQGHRAAKQPPPPVPGKPAFQGRRSALDAYAHLLGRVPDRTVAAMAGVTTQNVQSYRRRREIPRAESLDAGLARGPQAGTDAPLTEVTPSSKETTARAPKATPVAPDQPSAAHPPSPPPLAPSPPAPPQGVYAVFVETEQATRTYALIAKDIVTAAAAARERAAALGIDAMVKGVQYIADLLEFP